MADAGFVQPAAQRLLRDPDGARVHAELTFKWRMLVSAPAAIAGGSALEKIKPDAKLRTKSTDRVRRR